jgi:hypothetical protein
MKCKIVMAVLTTAILPCLAKARGHHFYDKGTLVEMNSVACGYDEKGAKGIGGVLLGTDSEHKKTKQMLCPEYVLRADRVEYRIRPKEEKHPRLLPVGEDAEFRLHKDMMYLRVPESDSDKERQYIVVAMTPRTDVSASPRASAKK